MSASAGALPTIKDFRPTGESSDAIRSAFFRLKASREANDPELNRLNEMRPSLLMSATQAKIDRADETARKRRVLAEQLDVVEAELRRSFTAAKEREEDEEFTARLAEVEALEAVWNADMAGRYPELAAEIIALLRREAALVAAFSELWRLPAAQRKLLGPGGSSASLTRNMLRASVSPRVQPGNPGAFADLLCLPNVSAGEALWQGRKRARR